MDYDDNFELSSNTKKHSKAKSDLISNPSVGTEKDLSQEITNLVLKGLNQTNRGATAIYMREKAIYMQEEPILWEVVHPYNPEVQIL